MQLNLLDISGNETKQSLGIQWLPIEKLVPHPDNPRLIYKEEIIEAIASSIEKDGFQPCYALLVRPFEDGYQILSGHTRLKASQKVGCKFLPCWVKEMSDEDAFFELVKANAQGELYPLEIGIHALKYVEPQQGVEGKGIQDYANGIGKAKQTISELRFSASVLVRLSGQVEVNKLLQKAKHLYQISKTPEAYWQQLTELLIANEWSVKQTEEICKAVREIDIPVYFRKWLDADKYIKEAIKEFEKDGKITIVENVKTWVEEGNNYLKEFESERAITIVKDDKEEVVYLNPKKMFLRRLIRMLKKKTDKPSKKKIAECSQSVLKYLQDADFRYKKWKESKANEEEKQKQKERESLAKTQLIDIYSPRYLMGDCREVFFEDKKGLIDLVLTDPPYLLSNDGITCRGQKQVSVNKNFDDSDDDAIRPYEWLSICYDYLKDGGLLVFSCTDHIYSEAFLDAQKIGFKHLETLIWYKKSSPPRLTTTGHRANFEYIAVFKKGTASHYFAYDEIKEELGNKQPSAVLEFEQCSGKEREEGGGHDTQKPLALWEYLVKVYSRSLDNVLDPFCGSGTTPVACKKLGRRSYWIEKKEEFYNSSLTRLDNTLFHFESDKKVLEKLIDEILKESNINNNEN